LRQLPFYLLDIGAGSHSVTHVKKWFPQCIYHGVDIVTNYYNDENDLKRMDKLFLLDLTKLQFEQIPDKTYDVLLMSHVVEHLYNGDIVLDLLLTKTKERSAVYIEFPSHWSTKLPHKKGTLNFYDDPTHCRLYTIDELSKILLKHGYRIVKSGTKRDWFRLLITPLKMIHSKLQTGYVQGSVFWDLLGFAEFIYAERK